jgi:hypothetical protein
LHLGHIMMVALCFNFFIRFPRAVREHKSFVCASASAAGGSGSDNDLNPYEVILDNSRFCTEVLML